MTPLTMVLAETTGMETIYYLHGLDLVAQSDGATTEYFAYDGLGSVRQVVSSAGEVLYGQGFDPYGNTYMSAGDEKPSWGFTGEKTDSNGLMFLRARYYAPQTGRFVSRDPWKGDMNKPVSYNDWIYGYANPLRWTDPTGQIPDEDGIRNDMHVYSCNCGWIDFGHANPSLPKDIFRKLKSNPQNISNLTIRENILLYQLRIGHPLDNMVNLGFAVYPVVYYPVNDQDLDSIALGMHILREEFRESLQCTARFGRSCFSEEDLNSDLIGFYMAVFGIEGDSYGNGSREWLAPICDFPLEREGKDGSRQWSLDVFRSYGNFFEGSSGIREWSSPRLIQTPEISSYCDNKPGGACSARIWPFQFQTIIPEKPSNNGNWWVYRVRDDGIPVHSNIEEIYFLHELRCSWLWWVR